MKALVKKEAGARPLARGRAGARKPGVNDVMIG